MRILLLIWKVFTQILAVWTQSIRKIGHRGCWSEWLTLSYLSLLEFERLADPIDVLGRIALVILGYLFIPLVVHHVALLVRRYQAASTCRFGRHCPFDYLLLHHIIFPIRRRIHWSHVSQCRDLLISTLSENKCSTVYDLLVRIGHAVWCHHLGLLPNLEIYRWWVLLRNVGTVWQGSLFLVPSSVNGCTVDRTHSDI